MVPTRGLQMLILLACTNASNCSPLTTAIGARQEIVRNASLFAQQPSLKFSEQPLNNSYSENWDGVRRGAKVRAMRGHGSSRQSDGRLSYEVQGHLGCLRNDSPRCNHLIDGRRTGVYAQEHATGGLYARDRGAGQLSSGSHRKGCQYQRPHALEAIISVASRQRGIGPVLHQLAAASSCTTSGH